MDNRLFTALAAIVGLVTVPYYYKNNDKMGFDNTISLVQQSQKKEVDLEKVPTMWMKEEMKEQIVKPQLHLRKEAELSFEPVISALSLDQVFFVLLIHTCGAGLVSSIYTVSLYIISFGGHVELLILVVSAYALKKFFSTMKDVKTERENMREERQGLVVKLMEVNNELVNKKKDCEDHVATQKEVKTDLEKVKTDLENKQKDCDGLVSTLTEVETGLKNQRYQIKMLLEVGEKEREVNKRKLQAVEKEITEKKKTFENTDELSREKENLLKEQWKLDETKKNNERQLLDIEKLLEPIEMQIDTKH